MQLSRVLEQHIAVFGESGSGKTVLLSSFYGAAQEPQYLQRSLFHVVAEDIGQGARLHRNFLGMRNSAQLPTTTRFSATSYSFSVKLRDDSDAATMKARPFDAMRLVWHDYPDPLGRKDRAGRVIPHEFVVSGSLAEGIESVEDGLRVIWSRPGVADEFARIWESPAPPSAHG